MGTSLYSKRHDCWVDLCDDGTWRKLPQTVVSLKDRFVGELLRDTTGSMAAAIMAVAMEHEDEVMQERARMERVKPE